MPTKLTEQDYLDALARREIDLRELVDAAREADDFWKWDLEPPAALRLKIHIAVNSHRASDLQVELCENAGVRLSSPPVLFPDVEVPLAD